jgi:hypothetical protein
MSDYMNIDDIARSLEQEGFLIEKKTTIHVKDLAGKHIASIFPEDGYVHFYEAFSETSHKALRELVKKESFNWQTETYIKETGYE